jgi:hypothetical protein
MGRTKLPWTVTLRESALTLVESPEFQLLHSIPVDGQVYAQPLLVPQVPWSDGSILNSSGGGRPAATSRAPSLRRTRRIFGVREG